MFLLIVMFLLVVMFLPVAARHVDAGCSGKSKLNATSQREPEGERFRTIRPENVDIGVATATNEVP